MFKMIFVPYFLTCICIPCSKIKYLYFKNKQKNADLCCQPGTIQQSEVYTQESHGYCGPNSPGTLPSVTLFLMLLFFICSVPCSWGQYSILVVYKGLLRRQGWDFNLFLCSSANQKFNDEKKLALASCLVRIFVASFLLFPLPLLVQNCGNNPK